MGNRRGVYRGTWGSASPDGVVAIVTTRWTPQTLAALIAFNYRRAGFWRLFRRGRTAKRRRRLWWIVGSLGWYFCWAVSSVMFTGIMDTLLTGES